MTLVMTLVFTLLLILAVPVGYALIISSTAAILAVGEVPATVALLKLFQQTQSFPLIAIPFFILAGALMMTGQMGEHLIEFANRLVARYRGGLGQATVIGATVFGGVSGSAVASASALGSIMIPWQRRAGYPAPFCAALNSSAPIIDLLIPPSIPMILYALVSNVSIGALFLAGVLPGLLLAVAFLAVCNIVARVRGFPYSPPAQLDRGVLLRGVLWALPSLLMPVFIVITLRFGIATPTEVSIIACAYALIVSGLIYRDLNLKRVYVSILSTGVITGVIMLVIMGSAPMGWIMTFDDVPSVFAEWARETLQSKWLIILAMNGIMLVIGTFLDLPPAILLLGPIFVPLAEEIGLDLVQLGLIMVLNCAIGLYTPPVGTTLFVSCSIAGVTMGSTLKDLAPFLIASLLVLLAISYIPALTLHF
jgi:tripartite ATP-independent transporter DctM subunit